MPDTIAMVDTERQNRTGQPLYIAPVARDAVGFTCATRRNVGIENGPGLGLRRHLARRRVPYPQAQRSVHFVTIRHKTLKVRQLRPRTGSGARYLRALDRADREEGDIAEAKSVRLKEKIAGLRRQMQALKAMEQTVQDAPDQQVSLTDPDARSMATSGKGTATVGYNVQIAVDAEHHLIETNWQARKGSRRGGGSSGLFRPSPVASDQVLSCEGTGVAPIVPKVLTSSGTKRGLFARQDFKWKTRSWVRGSRHAVAKCSIARSGSPANTLIQPLQNQPKAGAWIECEERSIR